MLNCCTACLIFGGIELGGQPHRDDGCFRSDGSWLLFKRWCDCWNS